MLVDRSGQTYSYAVPVRRGALYSLGVGFLSSFLGIGGGLIRVPPLVRALSSPPTSQPRSHISRSRSWRAPARSRISSLGASATATTSAGAAALSVGVVAGAQFGAHVSLRLRGAVIQWLLAGALLALAARLLYAV